MRQTRLDLDRIRAAREVIHPVFLATPLYPCDPLGHRLGATMSIRPPAPPPRRRRGRSSLDADGAAAGDLDGFGKFR